MCAFLVHTLANNSNSLKIQNTLDELEKKSIISNIEVEKKDTRDSIYFNKRGGVHSATWYNPHGSRTASGLKFHRDSLTAAYNFSEMHSYLKVTKDERDNKNKDSSIYFKGIIIIIIIYLNKRKDINQIYIYI